MGGTFALKDGLLDMEILVGLGPSGASTASPLLPYLEPCRQLHVTTRLTVRADKSPAVRCTKESYKNARKARKKQEGKALTVQRTADSVGSADSVAAAVCIHSPLPLP